MNNKAAEGLFAFVCVKCLGVVIPVAKARDWQRQTWVETSTFDRLVAGTGRACIVKERIFIHLDKTDHRPTQVIGKGFAS